MNSFTFVGPMAWKQSATRVATKAAIVILNRAPSLGMVVSYWPLAVTFAYLKYPVVCEEETKVNRRTC